MLKTVLITSGATREYIDPVRFITNASSGKMGRALAEAAVEEGFNVIVIKGPSPEEIKSSKKCKVTNVVSAKQMLEEVGKNLASADIFIGAAAVSDYVPVSFSKKKIKKNKNVLNLKLKKNPDIISFVSRKKKSGIIVGFALESDNLIGYASEKLKQKNMDMIVANGVRTISSEKTAPYLIFKDGRVRKLKISSKKYAAREIMREIKKL